MRKIEFRGKCIETGSWHYGNLQTTQDADGKRTVYIVEGGAYYIVEPKTVGEYTGMVDNYGEEIYEGDLVLIDGNVEEVYVVEWGLFGFMLTHFDADGSADTMAELNFFKPERLTVIDNVIDRKERSKWQ